MHRLLVALLAALDAVLAAAVGIAVVLAPLALLWVVGLGGADWSALWPATAAVWHLGHLVPVTVTLPDAYLAATGIDPGLATFTLSLAPLAFAAFTGLFAARSGVRAAESGAAVTGWLSGSVVFAGVAALIALTSSAPLLAVETWQAILFPSLVFAVPALVGALVGAWRVGDDGPIDRVRGWRDRMPSAWAAVPTLALRGVAITTLGLLAVGGVVVAVGLLLGGTRIIALFQASNVDAIGATVLALGQILYLPTLVFWAVAFVSGPGFALGTDTAVTPAATQVGALPGIPVLGALPDSTSSWLLLLALLPVGIGAVTGWILRSRMPSTARPEPVAPRLTLALVVAALTGGAGALVAVVSSGAIGPGRLSDTGPQPGPLALALGLEVLVGLAILLLSPRVGGSEVRVAEPREHARTFSFPAREHVPFDRDEHRTGPTPTAPATGVGISADVWPRAYGDPDAAVAAVPEEDSHDVSSDEEVRARIRAAWARDETSADGGGRGPEADPTGGRDARPVD